MLTQKKSAAAFRKLHSIHALPNGREFTGRIELGNAKYQFTFAPGAAALSDRKLKLMGRVTVQSPAGQKRMADKVEAQLVAVQGSIVNAPPVPRLLPGSLQPAEPAPDNMPVTDATGGLGSAGVIYLKLTPLDGRALGVPMDLSAVQVNARLYPQSEIERDLQWLYSALTLALDNAEERKAEGYLTEINRLLKA